MKSANKIVVEQDGWSLQKLTQWAISASYYHQGWCTSTDKDDFDSYQDRGNLWVLFRPNDRPTRPSYQIFVSNGESVEIMASGNRTRHIDALCDAAPQRVSAWLVGNVQKLAHEKDRRDAERIGVRRGNVLWTTTPDARTFSVCRFPVESAEPVVYERLENVRSMTTDFRTDTFSDGSGGWIDHVRLGANTITLEVEGRHAYRDRGETVHFEVPMKSDCCVKFTGTILSSTCYRNRMSMDIKITSPIIREATA